MCGRKPPLPGNPLGWWGPDRPCGIGILGIWTQVLTKKEFKHWLQVAGKCLYLCLCLCLVRLSAGNSPANKITSLQRPWKVLLSFCKRCVNTSWGRQCVEFSLRPQNVSKKRCAGTLTGRSGDVGFLWSRPGNVARKFCFHKNFPRTLSESFVSNRIVCLCSVNVV